MDAVGADVDGDELEAVVGARDAAERPVEGGPGRDERPGDALAPDERGAYAPLEGVGGGRRVVGAEADGHERRADAAHPGQALAAAGADARLDAHAGDLVAHRAGSADRQRVAGQQDQRRDQRDHGSELARAGAFVDVEVPAVDQDRRPLAARSLERGGGSDRGRIAILSGGRRR